MNNDFKDLAMFLLIGLAAGWLATRIMKSGGGLVQSLLVGVIGALIGGFLFRAFGIQFHPEVTRHTMHRWSVLGAHRFVLPGAQGARDHLDGNLRHDGPVKNWLSRFLDHWLHAAA